MTMYLVVGVFAVIFAVFLLTRLSATQGTGRAASAPARVRTAKPSQRVAHRGTHHWETTGDFAVHVVGESHYQRQLAALAGEHGTKRARVEQVAELVLDDSNKFDAKAVAVVIGGQMVGHLSRDDARSYRRRLGQKGLAGVTASCSAIIVGGGTRGKTKHSFGVMLDLKPFG
jgi:hypothetical protein